MYKQYVSFPVKPTLLHLSGVNNHVVQGSNVMLICDVHGARPAATIRWTNGSIPITDETLVHTGIEDNVSAIIYFLSFS